VRSSGRGPQPIGKTERILPHAITEQFVISASGALEPDGGIYPSDLFYFLIKKLPP
jgi:hypothetical protein